MYNPFPLFTLALFQNQTAEKKGKKYFVRQTFSKGFVAGLKAAFLFRGYAEDEKGLVELHMQQLSGDPNAFLYDLSNSEHRSKLQTASSQPAGFKIYYVGKTKLNWKPPPRYENKMRAYIRMRHPGWRTAKGKNKVLIGLHEKFGDIFLKFNFQEEEDWIPFDAIEKY